MSDCPYCAPDEPCALHVVPRFERWPRGRCEWRVPSRQGYHRTYCGKDGRWFDHRYGLILCGEHKKTALTSA